MLELGGEGRELPKARQVWPHNERYLWPGWSTLAVTTKVIRQLDLTNSDRLEGFPIVGEGEKIILFAVRRLGARWIVQLVTSASATPTVNGLLERLRK